MKTWLCLSPERMEKTGWIMGALAAGWPDSEISIGAPPDDGAPFVVWGQRGLAERVIPPAVEASRPFYHVDNGFWDSAKGSKIGNYRFAYRGMSPTILAATDARRAAAALSRLKPWRAKGRHIVIAIPGASYGACMGLDMRSWITSIAVKVGKRTDRPILIRPKECWRPLTEDLRNAWALVTHSSNVAVDAAVMGIPVFVAPTSPAAPVGNLDLDRLEYPEMPGREAWIASLACQQHSLAEMADGEAYRCLQMVREQVDYGRYLRSDAADGQRQSSPAPIRQPSADRQILG